MFRLCLCAIKYGDLTHIFITPNFVYTYHRERIMTIQVLEELMEVFM